MERQLVPIRFADLRCLAGAVQACVAKHTGEQQLSLIARLEDDLSCTGDDLVELLENFVESYRVEVASFDFTGLISPEGMDSRGCFIALFVLPLGLYWLTAWVLRAITTGLCRPFAPNLARSIWRWHIPYPTFETANRPNPLTVGDFVASAAAGRFVWREQVYFQLVR